MCPFKFNIGGIISHHITVNLNRAINRCIRNADLDGARHMFDQNPYLRNVVSWNSMIMAYFRQREVQHAQELFNEMPHRDLVSWNTMLSGFRHTNHPEKVYNCFVEMNKVGERPNELTLAVAISAFLGTKFNILIPQLHCVVICSGLKLNVFVGSALMRGYIDLGNCQGMHRVFNEILVKDDVTPWNVLILGYMEFGMTSEAEKVAFDVMPAEKNLVTWSTLINGYIKNSKVDEARGIFDKMSEKDKDVVSWTAMIKGYVQCGDFDKGLELFVVMLRKSSGGGSSRPNHYTFSSVLDACAGCCSLVMGSQVHACILKLGISLDDVILSTSLVDMYAKCGEIEMAFCIFKSMPEKNLVSWNSIIGGYGRHGVWERAVEELGRMVKSGVKPDEITFINVLSACVHGGKVEEGERIFNWMMKKKKMMKVEMEHYGCMVDLYGRAGELEKAENLIKGMPFEADVVVWGAFLRGCALHSCLERGEIAAKRIYKLQTDHPALSSWSWSSSKMQMQMQMLGAGQAEERGSVHFTKKQKACSWVG
ncbi:pentatricopeptide repeat-containing protein At4g02750-like [Ipomoea triloba]|uniref:pentatricopeptide repeat-containing protein At4g02750-like n=1 Tax=Ipomoea triloba TaxID=35885 RepID=UPI00125D0276|nr:pentatricopeptide repeat-containing protein At4g02750-like [Ipomoea triloba]GME09880.1 pentatricopeptide repeat-containing protein At4g02750-like [Ipomoea batatas]